MKNTRQQKLRFMVVLCVALFTLLVLFWTRTPHLPSLPHISPNCYLPKSGRHVTSLDQGLSSSEARSGKSLGTRLVWYKLLSPCYKVGDGKNLLQVVSTIPIKAICNKLVRACCQQFVNNLLRADDIIVGTTCCESVGLINFVTRW